MNKEKTNFVPSKRTFRSLLLLISLVLSTLCVLGQSTANYQDAWTVYPQFAVGTSGNVNYKSIIQVTNTNREERWYGKLSIHGTAVQGQAAPFRANYRINGWTRYPHETVADVEVPPLGTETFIFDSTGPLKAGFIKLNTTGSGARAFQDDISTSFFFQLSDVNTGELIDSVGVAPSDFGWHFAIPIIVSNKGGINTGIAYSHIPVTQSVQIVFELRDSTGKQLALKDNVITWADNTWVYPYHKAQFVTEIFPDYDFDKHRYFSGIESGMAGSLHIYAQRNINVLALRMDTKEDGNIQLTSVPSNGELCIDGPNRKDNCFQEDTRLDLGWVPVRKKSQNEIWLENDGVCEEDFDATGVCVR